MALTPGTRIGVYDITAHIGEGGMGQVFRATDTRLKRQVAIKILPPSVAADAERLARFQREAEVLASLNHPNIAAIYGLEESGGMTALVMELVEGDDLSVHIARGAMALADALQVGRQIAEALEAAHEQGIVHRDLKPANVKVRADGTVKVLDFGLAKAMDPPSPEATARKPLGPGPTMTSPARATQMGMIIGTAAYMSPEQARGRAVDRRADIWAFGVVLYEMLTGRSAFAGDTTTDIIAAVVTREPDWAALPASTPQPIRQLLARCLEKDPKRRLRDIGDARLELDEREAPPAMATIPMLARPSLARRVWPALVVFVLTAGAAALLWRASAPSTGESRVERYSLLPPADVSLYLDSSGVAISPDGSKVAFITSGAGVGGGRLWVRDLEALAARDLEIATGGVSLPFWSPDSQRIGFFSVDGKLNTIAVTGGKPDVLCPAAAGRGAAWSSSGVIVFAPEQSGPLYQVPASGGAPAPATKLDAGRKQAGHRMPTMLPDGDHFLYAVLPSRNGLFDIFAGSLSSSDIAVFVGAMESAPVYAEPRWLLFSRQGVLMAQAFDAVALKLQGAAVRLDDEPSVILENRYSVTAGRVTSASATGALAYFSAPSSNTQAITLSALGQVTGALSLPVGHYESLRIAPDGKRAAMVRSTSSAESQLWLVDLARGNALPLTSGPGRHDDPVWSPDGTRIVFALDADGPMDLYIKKVDDTSPAQALYRSELLFKDPVSWSADGRWIVVNQVDPGTAQDIWLLPMPGAGLLKLFVRTPGTDGFGMPSPDSRWIQYTSTETGRIQLYVQSFPEPGQRIQVSRDGGAGGWWSRDGQQILFTDTLRRTLWAVDVQPGASLNIGTPRKVATLPPNIIFMDAMPDRQSFIAIMPERSGPGSMTIVRNWRAALAGKTGR